MTGPDSYFKMHQVNRTPLRIELGVNKLYSRDSLVTTDGIQEFQRRSSERSEAQQMKTLGAISLTDAIVNGPKSRTRASTQE